MLAATVNAKAAFSCAGRERAAFEFAPRKPLFALRYGGICGKLHMNSEALQRRD
jgi:hypothetical protein